MTFPQEEEVFPSVNADEISTKEEVTVTNLEGEAIQGVKRKSPDKPAEKKVCLVHAILYTFNFNHHAVF